VLLGPLDVGLVGVALPSMTADLREDVRLAQAVMVVYLAALALAYIPAGRLGDRWSQLWLFRAGLALFALGALVVSLAPDTLVLLAGRAVQGLGAAASAAAGQVIAYAASGRERSGRNLGLVHSSVALGMIAGPLLGGAVIERAGWPRAFLIEPVLAAVAAALVRREASARAAGMSVPLRSILRERGLVLGLALAGLTFVAMSANMFVVPYFLQRPLGLTPAAAGAVMTIVPVIILVAGVPAGIAADRWSSPGLAVAGLLLVALGIGALAIAARDAVFIAAVLGLAVYGLGAALFQGPNNRAILRAAPPGALGLASGLLGASRQAGQVLGVLVSGQLLRAMGTDLSDPRAYAATFVVLAALAAGTAALAALRRG
jgi:MFS family permease